MQALLDRKFNKFLENKISNFEDINLNAHDIEELNSKKSLLELCEIVQWEKQVKTLVIDRKVFYKGISVEILGLEKRISKQLKNAKFIQRNCDYTWDFVTQYYLSFFMIITLSRLNGNYSTFFYKNECDLLGEIATSYCNNLCVLSPGQYTLNVKKIDIENDLVTIDLTFNKDTHVSAWRLFEKFIKDYRNLSGKRDTLEDNVFAILEEYFKEDSSIFCTLRNDLNYKYQRGFEDDNQIDIYDYIDWDSDDEEVLSTILKLQRHEEQKDSTKDLIVFNRTILFLFEKFMEKFKQNISIDF